MGWGELDGARGLGSAAPIRSRYGLRCGTRKSRAVRGLWESVRGYLGGGRCSMVSTDLLWPRREDATRDGLRRSAQTVGSLRRRGLFRDGSGHLGVGWSELGAEVLVRS